MTKIAVIGTGNMGKFIIQGLLHSKNVLPENIMATRRTKSALESFAKPLGIKYTTDNVEAMKFADVVIFGIKPQKMDVILEFLAPECTGKTIVSIAAGVTTAYIAAKINNHNVVRAMPNLGSSIAAGATALSPHIDCTPESYDMVSEIFGFLGLCEQVDEELMDSVTGLSGTGPMYIFIIIEALSDAGVKMGIPRETALKLAAQTVMGSAKLVLETGQHPIFLKDLVTSPGGTAISALHSLEKTGLRSVLIDAVETATLKSRELGDTLKRRLNNPYE